MAPLESAMWTLTLSFFLFSFKFSPQRDVLEVCEMLANFRSALELLQGAPSLVEIAVA